jgi:hypothetical protein
MKHFIFSFFNEWKLVKKNPSDFLLDLLLLQISRDSACACTECEGLSYEKKCWLCKAGWEFVISILGFTFRIDYRL